MDEEVYALPAIDLMVDDVEFVQPCGFVWFEKPRYRVKAIFRAKKKKCDLCRYCQK